MEDGRWKRWTITTTTEGMAGIPSLVADIGYVREGGVELPSPRENHDLAMCFVCGEANPQGLGLRWRLDAENGPGVVGQWRPEPWAVSWRGIIHGGLLTSVMDEAMGWAVALLYGRTGLTVRLTVRLRRAVAPGQLLALRAWVGRYQRRMAHTAAEMRNAEGSLVATAHATLYLTDQLPAPAAASLPPPPA